MAHLNNNTPSGIGETKEDIVQSEHLQHGSRSLSDDIDERLAKGEAVQMRSSWDNISPFRAALMFKKVTLIAFFAAFSASLDGYQINLTGSIVSHPAFITQMASSPALKAVDASYVSAWGGALVAGQIIGQIFLQFATDKLGRKVALYIILVVLALSVAVECGARNWGVWFLAKLVSGSGIGMMQATLPMYMGEQAPTQLRGFLMVAYTFWFNVGQLLAPTALRELKVHHPENWLIAVYTQWAMIGLSAIIYVLLPESPWWLVSQGRVDRAKKILIKYQGDVPGFNVEQQLAIMVATCEQEKRVAEAAHIMGFFSIVKGTNGWRLLIASWPKVTQQFVGLNLFNTYSTYFFQLAGNTDPFLVTVILTCCQLASVISTALLTDTVGRRPLTVYPFFVCAVSVMALGIVGCFDYANKTLGSLLIFFACLATFSNTGASAIGYAYLAEIPTQHLRARTTGWGLAFSNLFNLIFAFTTPIMLNGPSKWGVKTGFFFGSTGIICSAIGWCILPEIARRTPAEIDEMFESKVAPRAFAKYVTEVQRNQGGQDEQRV